MPHRTDPALSGKFVIPVYEALREAWNEHGRGPSQYELSLSCKCSTTSVINALRLLRKRGYIHAPAGGYRTTKPVDLDLTLSAEEPDPWADLDEKPANRYWRTP